MTASKRRLRTRDAGNATDGSPKREWAPCVEAGNLLSVASSTRFQTVEVKAVEGDSPVGFTCLVCRFDH